MIGRLAVETPITTEKNPTNWEPISIEKVFPIPGSLRITNTILQ
jgi:hypothetical protein